MFSEEFELNTNQNKYSNDIRKNYVYARKSDIFVSELNPEFNDFFSSCGLDFLDKSNKCQIYKISFDMCKQYTFKYSLGFTGFNTVFIF